MTQAAGRAAAPDDPRSGRAPARAARVAGFTLAEILLAATMGALLLIATASSVGLFGKQLENFKATTDSSLETALTSVSDDIRYAWWADVPSARQLSLCDPSGAQTTYAFTNGVLSVTRPDGSTGTVLDDLQSCIFSAQTLTRYREASPVTRAGTIWTRAAPTGVSAQALLVEAGDHAALGFTPAAAAPINGTTPGVTDQLTSATLGTFSLVIGAVGTGATVSPILGNLTIDLYRARAPNSGIPEGSSLGSISVAASGLPVATCYVLDSSNGHRVNVPSGNAWGWWKNHSDWVLVVVPTSTTVPLDLTTFAAVVKPGYSYTLVLGATISGIVVTTYSVASASLSGIAYDHAGAGYVKQAVAAARSLSGDMIMTRTTASTVTRRVSIDITRNDSSRITGSTIVLGQSMADDSWLGVVPGELGP